MFSRKAAVVIGVIVCIAMIIAGIVILAGGSSVSIRRFGGDFYSEEYAATRAVVINTGIIIKGIGIFLILTGLFGECLISIKANEEKNTRENAGYTKQILDELKKRGSDSMAAAAAARQEKKSEPVNRTETVKITAPAVPDEKAGPAPEEHESVKEKKEAGFIRTGNDFIKCMECGTVQRANRRVCFTCGAVFVRKEQEEE